MPGRAKPDEAYPTALIAAIAASNASKINSITTIFMLDLYVKYRSTPPAIEDGSDHPKDERG